MAFDAQARLWGLDTPYPSFQREDLGGALAPNGVAEEMNLYEFPYKNYGYPYCFTEYDLQPYTAASKGKGAQWVMEKSDHTYIHTMLICIMFIRDILHK